MEWRGEGGSHSSMFSQPPFWLPETPSPLGVMRPYSSLLNNSGKISNIAGCPVASA